MEPRPSSLAAPLTEADLRALWQNGRQPLPPFPPGTRFSPSAQDFLKDHGLTIRFAPALPAGLPAPLQARLGALHALAALTAAQARHFQLSALASRLGHLADGVARLPDDPDLPLDTFPVATLGLPPGMPNHIILHWLRLLHAEARLVAIQARESAVTHNLPARLDAMAAAVGDLEHRFLSGELAWPVSP
jgi:hypothetical protein